jgi:hypothetical protein
MSRKPKNGKFGPPVLQILTEEERQEFIRRRTVMETLQMQTDAMITHCNIYYAELREKYDLPRFFSVDMETGAVTRTEVPDESPIV